MRAFDKKEGALNNITQSFSIGDYVRIARKKKKFEKGSKTYTKNVYIIIDVDGNSFLC